MRLLPDDPLASDGEDIFRVHTSYARALANIIESSPSPFAIGLYGTWGSGKTSIMNLTQPLVEGKGHRWVYLDVWKYSRDPVRRWVLSQMETQLGLDDYTYEDRSLQSHLEFEEELETKLHPFEFIPRLTKGWQQILLASVALAVVVTAGLIVSGQVLLGTIIGALSLAVVVSQGLATLGINQKTKHVRSLPAVSADKFGAIFADMAKKGIGEDQEGRIIIVFDNLDRCPEDAAVDTLSAIKTFLDVPNCIYLVPCDEEALTTHILKSYKSYDESDEEGPEAREFAREYLRKFFQLTLRLPEVLHVDYERFVDAQVKAASAKPRFRLKDQRR